MANRTNVIAFPKAKKSENDNKFTNLQRSPELLLCMAMLATLTDEQKIRVFSTCSEAMNLDDECGAAHDAFGIAQQLCGNVAVG